MTDLEAALELLKMILPCMTQDEKKAPDGILALYRKCLDAARHKTVGP